MEKESKIMNSKSGGEPAQKAAKKPSARKKRPVNDDCIPNEQQPFAASSVPKEGPKTRVPDHLTQRAMMHQGAEFMMKMTASAKQAFDDDDSVSLYPDPPETKTSKEQRDFVTKTYNEARKSMTDLGRCLHHGMIDNEMVDGIRAKELVQDQQLRRRTPFVQESMHWKALRAAEESEKLEARCLKQDPPASKSKKSKKMKRTHKRETRE